MILNALILEGTISMCLLFAYFYVEPKFNKPSNNFLSMYNALRIVICLPFAEFLYGFLMQSDACKAGNNLCFATPDIFSHSLMYDIFYLRVNDTPNLPRY